MNTLLVCSGGLDSVTLAYKLATEHKLKSIISFNYNQKHSKELEFAEQCAQELNVDFKLIDITSLSTAFADTALTSSTNVPDGHYAQQTMKITEVPNRNAIFLSIAFAYAITIGACEVAIAVHGGDHFIYPDCRPEFLEAFNTMEYFSLEGKVRLVAPYAQKTKGDIAHEGSIYKVPFEKTWSCYKGQDTHCGRCGTCVERREAFATAKIADPTIYSDNDYWLEAIKEYNSQ